MSHAFVFLNKKIKNNYILELIGSLIVFLCFKSMSRNLIIKVLFFTRIGLSCKKLG